MGRRFRKPDPPLNVWNARKMEFNVSASFGFSSSVSTPSSMFCKCSADSLINSWSNSPSLSMFITSGSSGGRTDDAGDAATVAAGALALAAAGAWAGKGGSGLPACASIRACCIQFTHTRRCSIWPASKHALSKALSTTLRAWASACGKGESSGAFAPISSMSPSSELTGSKPSSRSGVAYTSSTATFSASFASAAR